MNAFFEWFYGLFASLYGQDLDSYLLGAQCSEEEAGELVFTGDFLYTPIGFVALAVAAVFFVVYYYIINSSKLNKWWHWFIVMLLVGVVNLFIGQGWTSTELPNIGSCLFVIESDFWMFGLANAFASMVFFIVLSFAGKWWSSSCKRTPF